MDLLVETLQQVHEIFLLLDQELTLPLPEGGNAKALFFVLHFVFFVVFYLVTDKFDIGDACSIVFTQTEILNSSKTSRLIFKAWNVLLFDILNCSLIEEVLFEYNISLIIFCLSASDKFFNKWTHFLGLLKSSRNSLMQHQVSDQVSHHCLSVFRVAPELTDVLLMSHFIIINN